MCIAVYKPQGIKMPSKKIFSNCFASNSHGAGFMFPLNGKVHYEKGFMTFSAFKKGLKSAIKKYGISTTSTPMVFHFRITSQGGVKPELTHPFPVCGSYDTMRQLSGDVTAAVVHNGIIDFASSYAKNIDYSDTMEFTANVVYRLINKQETTYHKNKTLMGLLNYLLVGNRFVIMTGDGHTELLGSWETDNGVYYSNNSYKTKPVNKGSWKSVKSLLPYSYPWEEDDNIGNNWKDPLDGYYFGGTLPIDKTNEFLKSGMLLCDCGQEMDIKWIDAYSSCYAFCPDCGICYKLTKAAEDYAFKHCLVLLEGFDEEDSEIDNWNASFGIGGGK